MLGAYMYMVQGQRTAGIQQFFHAPTAQHAWRQRVGTSVMYVVQGAAHSRDAASGSCIHSAARLALKGRHVCLLQRPCSLSGNCSWGCDS